jgi:hypothetical protein
MDMTMSSATPTQVEVVTSVQRRRRWATRAGMPHLPDQGIAHALANKRTSFKLSFI